MSIISESNPLGLECFDHVNFTVTEPGATVESYDAMGFTHTATRDEGRNVRSVLFEQGDIRAIITHDPDVETFAGEYRTKHSDGVCTLAFRAEDATHAFNAAVQRGATAFRAPNTIKQDGVTYTFASIRAFGDIQMQFITRSDAAALSGARFLPGYVAVENPAPKYSPLGLTRIDHLTNNVYQGDMDKWCGYYHDVFGWEQARYFDIKGEVSGLQSKVMRSKDKRMIIPINEPRQITVRAVKGQIEEYLEMHKGEGVQHIAYATTSIIPTIRTLRARGFKFLNIPPSYYADIPTRVPGVREPMNELADAGIMVDGENGEYLLQLFTAYMVGPLFYEFIQRVGHDGFGEGNFTALFEAIERDQRERGVLA